MVDALVIGAGRMGPQIACEYALGGCRVALLARDRERGTAAARAAFAVAAAAGLHRKGGGEEAEGRLSVVVEADEIAWSPEIVIESVPEEIELKAGVLGPIAQRWPEAILASNSSSLSIGSIGAPAGASQRTLGTHYWNPPLLMPLVEVIPGEETSPEVVDRVTATLVAIGKRPVTVGRDVPGFIWNRLQFALLREALWLIEAGVAAPGAIDEVVRDGLARRWRLTGPFETAELGGVETFARVSANLFPELSCAQDAPALEDWRVREPAALAEIAARRDAALAKELRAS